MHLLRPAFAALALVTTLWPALADDSAKELNDLPGVQGGHSIVKKEPPPEPEPGKDDGVYRYGDWEVRVSGSVSVQIGFGEKRDGLQR